MSTAATAVREFHERLWGRLDVTAIDDHVAPGATTVMTGFEGATVDVLRADVERYVGAFTEVRTEIVELVDGGDRVALWWRTTGRHTGPYGDIAPTPTGALITREGVDVYDVDADGKVVRLRSAWDAAAVYRQFGLLPDGL